MHLVLVNQLQVRTPGWPDNFGRDQSGINFYGGSIPITDSSRAIVSYRAKYDHLVQFNCLGGLSPPRNSLSTE